MRTSALLSSIAIGIVAATGSGVVPTHLMLIPSFDPSDFVQQKQNPYFPLRPGTVLFYRSVTEDGVETSSFMVTNMKKTILGVQTTVIHDREFLDGELFEDTFDWYAADRFGNVWYFGEDTREIEDGQVVSTSGSWEAGRDGASPGIIMLANPWVGATYREENRPGEAEDMAKVVHLNKSVRRPAGFPLIPASRGLVGMSGNRFVNVLKTRNWNPLDPGTTEWKYYARGVGPVLETQRDEEGNREVKRLTRIILP